jgi:prophage regulatory protein
MTNKKVLRISSVVERTGLARPTIYKLMANDKFPGNIKLTPRATAWVAEEVDRWVEDRIRDSRDPGADANAKLHSDADDEAPR